MPSLYPIRQINNNNAFDGCDKLVIYAPEGSAAYRLANSLGIQVEKI